MRLVFTTILISLSMPFPAEANDFYSWDFALPHKRRCSTGTMTEMDICIAGEYSSANARLNKIFMKLNAALEEPKQLQKTQQTWLEFRDAQCALTTPGDGTGREYNYSLNACLIDLIEKRILDLENIRPCNGCVHFKAQFYEEGMWPERYAPAIKADAPPPRR